MSVAITSAQTDDGNSTIFYVNKNKVITTYVSRQNPERGDNDEEVLRYTDDYARVDSKQVKVNSPDLTAITWVDDNDSSFGYTRLYYIDDQNILQELCQDNSTKWYIGSLGKFKFEAVPNSALSSHINITKSGKQLKVYFWAKGVDNQGRPSLAYVTLGGTKWELKHNL